MSSITDVPGFRVGQVERVGEGWLTGVTVVVPPRGTVAQAVIRGSAPASHQVAALHPGATSPTPQAIVLTGGSSYGLIAAHGVARRFAEVGLGYAAGPGPHDVIPLVPAAAIYDVGRGGDFHAVPTEQMGYDAAAQAIVSADHADVRRGSVGRNSRSSSGPPIMPAPARYNRPPGRIAAAALLPPPPSIAPRISAPRLRARATLRAPLPCRCRRRASRQSGAWPCHLLEFSQF